MTTENEAKRLAYPLAYDMGGIVLIGFSVALLFSLITYSPLDDTFQIHGTRAVQNWIGPGGAVMAYGMYTVFGVLALLWPFVVLGWGIMLLYRRAFWQRPWRFVGLMLMLGGLGIMLESTPFIRRFLSFPPGGLFGHLLKDAFDGHISSLGTWITAMCLSAMGLVLLTQAGFLANLVGLWRSPSWLMKDLLPKLKAGRLAWPKRAAQPVAEPITQEQPKEAGFQMGDALPLAASGPRFEMGELAQTSAIKPEFLRKIEEDKDRLEAQLGAHIVPRQEPSPKLLSDAGPLERPKDYQLPPLNLLDYDAPTPVPIDEDKLRQQSERLKQTFEQFGILGHVREIRPGPVVTLFEFVPAPGIKLSRIAALSDDIAMAMFATHVRVVAPIPGKGAVGIEIPNEKREVVYLKEIIANKNFGMHTGKLWMALGKTIEGRPYMVNLADMPHVLIAGTTGSGKSVSVNAMICSILYRSTPQDVRFLMIDPKMLELSIYDGIPHLLLPPIIDAKKAAAALRWAVAEMDRRYQQMNELSVRDIYGFNEKVASQKLGMATMPFIVIVVDEYADLLAIAGKDVEGYVMRLAQKARACGIHVMLATQRPSVDIITGVIKANFPVRIGFRLASAHDSKTIINRSGAEKLLGRGDMLLMPPGTSDLTRVHGAYVSEKELLRVIEFWKEQKAPDYDHSILVQEQEASDEAGFNEDSGRDERYQEAVDVVLRTQKCSTSWLQRQMGVGYNRAARMVEQMEKDGIVGPIQSAKGDREIFGAQ